MDALWIVGRAVVRAVRPGNLHLSTVLESGTDCMIDQKAAATDRPRIVNKIFRSWDYTRRKTPMSVPVVHAA
jgi:hypothetical protein